MYINCKPETKAQAIELHNAGKSVTAISKELNISESTLRNWFLQYSTPQSVHDAVIYFTVFHRPSRLRYCGGSQRGFSGYPHLQ